MERLYRAQAQPRHKSLSPTARGQGTGLEKHLSRRTNRVSAEAGRSLCVASTGYVDMKACTGNSGYLPSMSAIGMALVMPGCPRNVGDPPRPRIGPDLAKRARRRAVGEGTPRPRQPLGAGRGVGYPEPIPVCWEGLMASAAAGVAAAQGSGGGSEGAYPRLGPAPASKGEAVGLRPTDRLPDAGGGSAPLLWCVAARMAAAVADKSTDWNT